MTRAERRRMAREKKDRDLIYVPYDVEQEARAEMPKKRRRRTLVETGLRDDSVTVEESKEEEEK